MVLNFSQSRRKRGDTNLKSVTRICSILCPFCASVKIHIISPYAQILERERDTLAPFAHFSTCVLTEVISRNVLVLALMCGGPGQSCQESGREPSGQKTFKPKLSSRGAACPPERGRPGSNSQRTRVKH